MDLRCAFAGRGRGGFGHCGRGFGHHLHGHHERGYHGHGHEHHPHGYHEHGHHANGHHEMGHHSHGHHGHGHEHHPHGHHEMGHHAHGHPENGHFDHGHHHRGHEQHSHGDHFHGPRRHGHEHRHLGHHFDSSDDEMLEIPRQEYKKECKRGQCKKFGCTKKVLKNSVDPLWTVVETKEGKFTVSIPLGKDAKAEDVKLSVKDRDLYIEIKLKKSSEDGSSHLSQVFTKKIALPEEVKVEDMQSNLTPEGVLKIEASVQVLEEIAIPVKVDTE